MPQLIDYNQIILASLFVSIGKHTNIPVEESMIRHMFLNTIRSVRKKFYAEYGEIVICADGKNSWRKGVFPYYKANRKKDRDASELDWNHLFSIMTTLRTELKEIFPYKVIHLDHVEADDIIGVICNEFGTPLNSGERFIIYSSDKDYIQLHTHGNVDQYDPVRKKWIRNNDPDKYLMEHILRGDVGDGIPNVLSPDNTLVIGERQKPMTVKRLEALSDVSKMDETTKARYFRNKMLIDLSEVPAEYKAQILDAYSQEPTIDRSKMFNYFLEKRLQHLLPNIGDF